MLYCLLSSHAQFKIAACRELPIVAFVFNHSMIKDMYKHIESRGNFS